MHAVRRIAVAVPLLLLATIASAEEPKPPESKEAKPPVTTTEKISAWLLLDGSP